MLSPSSFPYDRIDGENALRFIETQARISHMSGDLQTEDSWKKFIEAVVLKHGDWSVCEHASVTVRFRVDRGITHEIVRHRLFSFTQESTRFVNYEKKSGELEFIKPIDLPENGLYDWKWSLTTAEKAYFNLLQLGARPQEARSVLPNALASTIAMTGNLRAWKWFFLARCTKESHPDMRRVTVPLLKEFQDKIPLLYDDVNVLEKQSISMAKVH